MQKIIIIGAGSLGIAAQLSSLACEKDLPLVFISSAEPEPDLVLKQHVDAPHYQPAAWRGLLPTLLAYQELEAPQYRAPLHTHSFDGSYFPTAAETDWLDLWQCPPAREVVRVTPPVVADQKMGSLTSGCFTFSFAPYPQQAAQLPGPSRKARKAARRRQKRGHKACR